MNNKERLENMSPVGFDLNGNILLKSEDYHWLMEQVERYEDLLEQVKQIEKVSDYNADLLMKYEKALEFYATEEHYKEELISEAQYDADGVCISNDEYAPPIIYLDSGEKARKALEGKE